MRVFGKLKKAGSKALSVSLAILMVFSCFATAIADNGGAVVTDSVDYDILLNVDAAMGMNPNDLADLVEHYLQQLIDADNGSETYRISTTAAQIDPTDLTKWYVYDHYDNSAWYSNEAAWKTNYPVDRLNLDQNSPLPSHWYYYQAVDGNSTGNNGVVANGVTTGKLTLEQMFMENIGTKNRTAKLREHIYAYNDLQTNRPSMLFYGYGVTKYADFLFYPASKTSAKNIVFDVDASLVIPHSLMYAGVLINTGVDDKSTTTTTDDTISGYLLVFKYGTQDSRVPAVTLDETLLYKLTDVNVDNLHSQGLRGRDSYGAILPIPGATNVDIDEFKQLADSFWQKSRIVIDATSTSIKATIQKVDDNGNITGSAVTLFDQTVDDTGYGGFGPYVDYATTWNHACADTASFQYSNLQMSFVEPLSGDSVLEAYKYTDYLENSQERFFVNITNPYNSNYKDASDATNADLAYLTLMQNDQTVLITDETLAANNNPAFTSHYLGSNSKDINNSTDMSGFNPGDFITSNAIEELAAKIAWSIYNSTYDANQEGDIDTDGIIIAKLKLMDGPGSGSGINQVNSIRREFIEPGGLKVYLNTNESTNHIGYDATYTLIYPNGDSVVITPEYDVDDIAEQYPYFIVENDQLWPDGEYNISVYYNPTTPGKTPMAASVAGGTKFTIQTDPQAPAATIDVTKADYGTINIAFVNTSSQLANTYVSNLASYYCTISTSSVRPSSPAVGDRLAITGTGVSNIPIGSNNNLGTQYYVHVFVYDAVGNEGYSTKPYTVKVPLSVDLVSTGYDANTGITILPSFDEGGYTVDNSTRVLRYREVGTNNWLTVDTGSWSFGGEYTIPFSGLNADTKYEVELSASDNRAAGIRGTDTATLTFRTPAPDARSKNTGTADVSITNPDGNDLPDGDYTIVIKDGDTVIASITQTVNPGDGDTVTVPLTDLPPDGTFTVEINGPDGRKNTESVTMDGGTPTGSVGTSMGEFIKNTQLVVQPNTPSVAVSGLSDIYDYFDDPSNQVQDPAEGITGAENGLINSSGSRTLIDLRAEAVDESAPPAGYTSDVSALQIETAGRSNALYIDLTLWKTIQTTSSRTESQMNQSGDLLTIIIPIPSFNGSDLKIHRIHEGTVTELGIGPAKANGNGEYWEQIGDNAVLHVRLFSIYAFTYVTPKNNNNNNTFNPGNNNNNNNNNSNKNDDSKTGNEALDAFWGNAGDSITNAESGSTVIIDTTTDATVGNITTIPADLIEVIKANSDVEIIIDWNGGDRIVIPAGADLSQFTEGSDVALIDLARLFAAKATLNRDEHIVFIYGRPGNLFEPNANLTRAETAAIFARLSEGFTEWATYANSFKDVDGTAWYANYIGYLDQKGIALGDDNGYFNPDAPITRAEFIAFATRFEALSTTYMTFSDVPSGHWAIANIITATENGWLEGYPDGTVRPDNNISRAEAVALVCRMLDRIIDADSVAGSSYLEFDDVKSDFWGYYYVIESAAPHGYKKEGGHEYWI